MDLVYNAAGVPGRLEKDGSYGWDAQNNADWIKQANRAITPQMQKDWASAFTPGAQAQSFQGGLLSAPDASGARYFTAPGSYGQGPGSTPFKITKDMDPAQIAATNPYFAAQWRQQYNYQSPLSDKVGGEGQIPLSQSAPGGSAGGMQAPAFSGRTTSQDSQLSPYNAPASNSGQTGWQGLSGAFNRSGYGGFGGVNPFGGYGGGGYGGILGSAMGGYGGNSGRPMMGGGLLGQYFNQQNSGQRGLFGGISPFGGNFRNFGMMR